MPVSDAKEMILRTSAKELLKYRPSWLKDCVRISVSAQDITTGEILYRRTINIKKKGDSDMKKAFKIFSIMFVIEMVLIAILDAMA